MRTFAFVVSWLFVSAFTLSAAETDFVETLPDGNTPPVVSGNTDWETNFVGAIRQPSGSLSGRLIFTCGGHGWTWGKGRWYTQRGVGNEMNEDYGNLDQMNFFVPYAFNAGATVVTFRPIGHQTNEVVLDNDSRGVSFVGKWFESRSEIYFGDAGAVPYRFAQLQETETATATYTPRIPLAGFYPVYTWVRHGADRTSQLYRVLHTGGQTLVRIPHNMVGNGWVYLGTYYFDAGSNRTKGSVIVSNLQPSPGFGAVAVADAIRFGNGMGDFVPEGGVVSTYPREEEAARYWIERSFGQGQSNFLSSRQDSDHQGGNVGAPIRMAREMNREAEGNLFKRIYLGFHSNAGGGRGTVALWNNPELFPGTKTPNQQRYAELIGKEVNDEFAKMKESLEVPWFDRTRLTYARNDYAFGELNDRYIGGEFDATILEVAFHDNADDSKLMRDPKVRDLTARSSYRAIIRYMNEFDALPLDFLPEPPRNVRAIYRSGEVVVEWDKPLEAGGSDPEEYEITQSPNGYGFGNPVRVPGNQTSAKFENLPDNRATFFRVTAVNRAGVSLPSGVAACRPPSTQGEPKILFVNGFTERERFNNPRQTIEVTNYVPMSATGAMDRVIPRLNNAFDYVVQYADALEKRHTAFDSCQRDAVSGGLVRLENYDAVIWAAGRQRTNLFDANEQRAVAEYVDNGGNLFLSGAHIAENIAQAPAPLAKLIASSADPIVTNNSVTAASTSAFRDNPPIMFGEAEGQSYFVATANALLPSGGATAAVHFKESQVAGIQYDGSNGGGKVVCFGFPFETISSGRSRTKYLSDVVKFFDLEKRRVILTPRLAWNGSDASLTWTTEPGRKYQVQFRYGADSALWQNLTAPIIASGLTANTTDTAANSQRNYRVIPLN